MVAAACPFSGVCLQPGPCGDCFSPPRVLPNWKCVISGPAGQCCLQALLPARASTWGALREERLCVSDTQPGRSRGRGEASSESPVIRKGIHSHACEGLCVGMAPLRLLLMDLLLLTAMDANQRGILEGCRPSRPGNESCVPVSWGGAGLACLSSY